MLVQCVFECSWIKLQTGGEDAHVLFLTPCQHYLGFNALRFADVIHLKLHYRFPAQLGCKSKK